MKRQGLENNKFEVGGVSHRSRVVKIAKLPESRSKLKMKAIKSENPNTSAEKKRRYSNYRPDSFSTKNGVYFSDSSKLKGHY